MSKLEESCQFRDLITNPVLRKTIPFYTELEAVPVRDWIHSVIHNCHCSPELSLLIGRELLSEGEGARVWEAALKMELPVPVSALAYGLISQSISQGQVI